MVNFRYSSGCMHIAITAWMADSTRSIKPTLLVVPYVRISTRQTNGDLWRRRSQDLLMTVDIDANLPDRPSLEGYKIDVLLLDSVVHLFKRFQRAP